MYEMVLATAHELSEGKDGHENKEERERGLCGTLWIDCSH